MTAIQDGEGIRNLEKEKSAGFLLASGIPLIGMRPLPWFLRISSGGLFSHPPRNTPWVLCALFFSAWGIAMVAFQEFPAGFWQDVLLLGVLAGGLLVLLLLGYSPLLLGLAVFVLWLLAVYLSFSLPSPGAAPLLPLLGAATLLSVVRSSTRGVVLTVTMLGCFIFAAYPVVVTYNHSVAGLDLAGRVLLAGPALVLHLVARLSARIEQTLERERQKNLQLEKTVGVLSRANVGFQQYAQNLEVRSRDEERKRITRDLHDTIGYMISAITVMLDAALGFLHSSPERCAEVLQKARNHVDATHQETRTALHALHSLESATAFGVENIHEIAKSFGAATGVKVEVFFSNVAKTYGGVVDATMYRFVQEALVNAFRHGKAKNIQVALWHHPGELQVYVRDDGEGSSDLEEGIGFLGMRERLSQVQGQLAYETLKSGFRVTARIPVEPNPEAGKARKDAPEGTLKEEER